MNEDHKIAKKTDSLIVFFALLGFPCVKSACETYIGEIDPRLLVFIVWK